MVGGMADTSLSVYSTVRMEQLSREKGTYAMFEGRAGTRFIFYPACPKCVHLVFYVLKRWYFSMDKEDVPIISQMVAFDRLRQAFPDGKKTLKIPGAK